MYGSVAGSSMDVPQQPSVFDVIRQYRDATQPQQSPSISGFQSTYDPAEAQQNIQATLQRIQQASRPAPMMSPTSPVDLGGGDASAQRGKFKITGPNPGRLRPELVSFAEQVAGVYGHPLTGSDGSGHSRLTVNGNVSEHTTGNATDIPAKGRQLIAMGQAALIAAGMDPAEARKQTGGLYNVGNHQIIFNTHEGGDHTDHLHISTHAKRR